MTPDAREVFDFWFVEHGEDDWFAGTPEFDSRIETRFHGTHSAVAAGEGYTWRTTPQGRVAEIVVLDQFSRQLFRGSRQAFASDGMALVLAQELVARGLLDELPQQQALFALMPYQHSESPLIHEEAVRLFTALGDEEALDYELRHKEVIERFGRYPMRNAALGRVSTEAEIAYIASRDKNEVF